jgi:hypothetical protein
MVSSVVNNNPEDSSLVGKETVGEKKNKVTHFYRDKDNVFKAD